MACYDLILCMLSLKVPLMGPKEGQGSDEDGGAASRPAPHDSGQLEMEQPEVPSMLVVEGCRPSEGFDFDGPGWRRVSDVNGKPAWRRTTPSRGFLYYLPQLEYWHDGDSDGRGDTCTQLYEQSQDNEEERTEDESIGEPSIVRVAAKQFESAKERRAKRKLRQMQEEREREARAERSYGGWAISCCSMAANPPTYVATQFADADLPTEAGNWQGPMQFEVGLRVFDAARRP